MASIHNRSPANIKRIVWFTFICAIGLFTTLRLYLIAGDNLRIDEIRAMMESGRRPMELRIFVADSLRAFMASGKASATLGGNYGQLLTSGSRQWATGSRARRLQVVTHVVRCPPACSTRVSPAGLRDAFGRPHSAASLLLVHNETVALDTIVLLRRSTAELMWMNEGVVAFGTTSQPTVSFTELRRRLALRFQRYSTELFVGRIQNLFAHIHSLPFDSLLDAAASTDGNGIFDSPDVDIYDMFAAKVTFDNKLDPIWLQIMPLDFPAESQDDSLDSYPVDFIRLALLTLETQDTARQLLADLNLRDAVSSCDRLHAEQWLNRKLRYLADKFPFMFNENFSTSALYLQLIPPQILNDYRVAPNVKSKQHCAYVNEKHIEPIVSMMADKVLQHWQQKFPFVDFSLELASQMRAKDDGANRLSAVESAEPVEAVTMVEEVNKNPHVEQIFVQCVANERVESQWSIAVSSESDFRRSASLTVPHECSFADIRITAAPGSLFRLDDKFAPSHSTNGSMRTMLSLFDKTVIPVFFLAADSAWAEPLRTFYFTVARHPAASFAPKSPPAPARHCLLALQCRNSSQPNLPLADQPSEPCPLRPFDSSFPSTDGWIVPCSDWLVNASQSVDVSSCQPCDWPAATWSEARNVSPGEAAQCLKNVRMVFVGDSTLRGVMYYLIQLLQADGRLKHWSRSHTRLIYQSLNTNATAAAFGYYPPLLVPFHMRSSFTDVLRDTLARFPFEVTHLVVGGVQWLRSAHLYQLFSIIHGADAGLRRTPVWLSPKVRVIVKGLGSGFTENVPGMPYTSQQETTELYQINAHLRATSERLGFSFVDTWPMTLLRRQEFMGGKCACHFHSVKRLPDGSYKVFGDINQQYSNMILSKLC